MRDFGGEVCFFQDRSAAAGGCRAFHRFFVRDNKRDDGYDYTLRDYDGHGQRGPFGVLLFGFLFAE